MKNVLKISSLAAAVTVLGFFSCSDDESTSTTDESAVIENYADIVYQSYKDSYDGAVTLQSAVNTLVTSPSEANLTAAKTAWLNAREVYGQTEAYREASGPIDTENESWSLANEGQMNAWPMDEGYVDYIIEGTEAYAGTFDATIIEGTEEITETYLAEQNEAVSDKSISTGWHAIEFLLWGQDETDPSENIAGQRTFVDYTDATNNYVRRGEYLKAATDLLVSDLNNLTTTWASGGDYRTVFEALDEGDALKQLLNGAFFIAGDELSSERMIAPVNSADGINSSGQEDEHSCFSDNTHVDVWANAQGVYNVVFGEYSTVSGTSFYDLVNDTDADQAAALKTASDNAMAAVNVILNNSQPFDYLITQENVDDANLGPVMSAVEALQDWADVISASAKTIGVDLE